MSYIVPALRKAANEARTQAEEVLRAAAIEAEKLRTTANEIDVIADQKMHGTSEPATCGDCLRPMVRDELGWRHMYETTCTANTPAAEATQTGEMPAVVTS